MIRRILLSIRDERGSLSVLIMSFFLTIVTTLLVLTNISSVYLAKRSLTQITEAAAQRGVRNLDLDAYYRSQYNATKLALNVLWDGERDPGIPIDCQKGASDAINSIAQLSSGAGGLTRENLSEIKVVDIDCDGYQISLRTSATVALPFILPFTGIKELQVVSEVGSFGERKITTNYYGINIG
jgi:hypothetical protein